MSGGFIAVPFGVIALTGNRLEKLLEHMCENPTWFNAPMSRDEIWANCLYMLNDPSTWKWEVWRGGEFVGMLIVDRISPRMDALMHFTIFPGVPLFGLQKLLASFLGSVFEQFELQRISVEIPEKHHKLIKFFQQRLCFKLENEIALAGHPIVQLLQGKDARKLQLYMTDPAPYLARLGSRKESAHWDGEQYQDLILLRLTREEHTASVISPASDEANAARVIATQAHANESGSQAGEV